MITIERRNAVLKAIQLFDINKPFKIRELIDMCDVSAWDKEQIMKNLSVWTNSKFSSPQNDRIRKVIHRVPGMGTGWYVKISDITPRAIKEKIPILDPKDIKLIRSADEQKEAVIDAPAMKFDLPKPASRKITRYYLFGIRIWEVVKFVR